MTVEDFLLRENQIYTPFLRLLLSKLKICTFSSLFPDWNARIVYALIYTDTSIALQSQWYTRPSGFLTRSSNQSESSQINQIRRSISSSLQFLFSVLFVYEMLARPTRGLFSIENVLKLHAPLRCTAVHNFCQKRVFIIFQYKCCLVQNCTIF